MINEIFLNFAKILFGIGIICLFLKILLGRRDENSSEKIKLIIYNVHRITFILSTVFAFIHGLTYVPINQSYIITGWFFGIFMVILCIIGIRMGFKNNWKPYTKEQNIEYKKIRIFKWILTIMTIIFLGMHYLL